MDYSAGNENTYGTPLQMTWGGWNLFYKIQKIITKTLERSTQLKCISPIKLITVSLMKQMNPAGMSLAHINTRSIVNKIQPFQQYILDHNIDVCAVTEMLIKKDDVDMITKEVLPPGYNILSHPHIDRRSGCGLGMVCKDYITISSNRVTKNHNTMEYMRYSLRIKQTSIDICVIYRFPCRSVIDFCSKVVSEIEKSINLTSNRCVYIGDFNNHIDANNPDTTTFNDFMESFNLKHLVSFPTCIHQHTLDLILDDIDN